MKVNFEEARIYVRPGSTDLRKGISGLCSIIVNEMNLDALCGSAFLFCNKTHRLMKVIFWDKSGFWLAQKKLEKSTWPWPNTEEAAREIKPEQLEMLLAGIDFWRAHEELHFDSPFCNENLKCEAMRIIRLKVTVNSHVFSKNKSLL